MTNLKIPAFRMLFLIAPPKLTDQAVDMFREGSVPVQYQFRGQGTASQGIINWLGLDTVEKSMMMSIMPRMFANEMLKKLRKQLHLGMPNTGIAFTVPMLGGSSGVMQLTSQLQPEAKTMMIDRREREMAECEYCMIMAIINQGYSDAVMEAARPLGASGGTVFHSRRIGSEEAMNFWGISVQQEREVVIILVKKTDKLPIMQAIGEKCGMKTEAHGVVFSMPVDNVVGLD